MAFCKKKGVWQKVSAATFRFSRKNSWLHSAVNWTATPTNVKWIYATVESKTRQIDDIQRRDLWVIFKNIWVNCNFIKLKKSQQFTNKMTHLNTCQMTMRANTPDTRCSRKSKGKLLHFASAVLIIMRPNDWKSSEIACSAHWYSSPLDTRTIFCRKKKEKWRKLSATVDFLCCCD